jgi:DNA-binding HxlR family transcriptional regulator
MSQAPETSPLTPFCPAYSKAIEIIGRRWSGSIIRSMLAGASRFSEIRAAVPGLSDRLLSERLKQLEAEGIVERSVVPSTPVRVDYRLTDKGLGLGSVVRSVNEWAETWGPQEEDAALEA